MQHTIQIVTEGRFTEREFFNQALLESSHFKVLPSLGSLVEGWLLIVPKKHFICFGALESPNLYQELDELVAEVCSIVEREFGDYIIFEHGPSQLNSVVGCGVDHAHLHIVPMTVDLMLESKRHISNCVWNKAEGIESTRAFFNRNENYLFIQDNDRSCFIATAPQIPSQTFRKIIAEKLGISNKYDWKKYPFLSNIERTITRVAHSRSELNVTKNLQHERSTA
jgi:ATP adenylyltransferase